MEEKIFPTKANLLKLKNSLKLSRGGYDLMDKKRNILIKEAMDLVDEAKELREQIAASYISAYTALKNSNISGGTDDITPNTVPLNDTVTLKSRSLMGVVIPEVSIENTVSGNPFGYRFTDEYSDEATLAFKKVLELTLKLAEVESSVYRLSVAIKKTGKRANALKNIVIPRYENSEKEIAEILEEREREEFSRLKVIKDTK